MRALEFITGHVIYNPAYTYKFQLKTTTLVFIKFNQQSDGKIIDSRQSNMNYCATYLNSIFFLGVHCRSPEGQRGRNWASWTEEYLSFGPQ